MLPCGTRSVLTCAGKWPQHCAVRTQDPCPCRQGDGGGLGGPQGVNSYPSPNAHLSPGSASSALRHPVARSHLHPLHLIPSEGLTMGGTCWLLSRPHICKGKLGDRTDRDTLAMLQDLHSHQQPMVQPHRYAAEHDTAQHGTVPPPWARWPQLPGTPAGLGSGTAQHGMAQHWYSTVRTHPQCLQPPRGCPADPHLLWPRCHPQGHLHHPHPEALWAGAQVNQGSPSPHPGQPRATTGDI